MTGFVKKLFGKVFHGHHEGPEGQATSAVRKEEDTSEEPADRPLGFRVQKVVPSSHGTYVPVIQEVARGEGGIQGLSWYCAGLRLDEDGDVAHEFWREVVPPLPGVSPKEPKLEPVLHPPPRPIQNSGPAAVTAGNVTCKFT